MNNTNEPHKKTPVKKRPAKSFFKRWEKRIRNVLPSTRAVKEGFLYCLSKLTHTFDGIKKDTQEAILLVRKAWSTLNAFSPYQTKTPFSKAMDCPLQENPLIVKIESIGDGSRHSHGAAFYNGIVVDSDGNGQNTTRTGQLDIPEADSTATYFVLYPSKMGLNSQILTQSMQEEANKKNDYDLYINNCIDHVIRPLQKAGAQINFGKVATPQELCVWCDKMCHDQQAGYYLNETEYQLLLKRIDEKNDMQKKNLQFMNALAELSEQKAPITLEERTAGYPDHFPSGIDNTHLASLEERTASYKKHYPSGKESADMSTLVRSQVGRAQASL